MAFGNSQNEKKQKKTTNTKGLQFYNKSTPVGAGTLQTGNWEQTMTIRVSPLLPENKRTDSAPYDYDTFISVALTLEKLEALYEGVQYIYDQIDAGNYDFSPVGQQTGANYIEIAPASKLGLAEGVAIILYSDINEDGKASNVLPFLLNRQCYFKNYSSEDGSYDRSEPIEVQFNMLRRHMKATLNAMNNAHAHSIRYINQYRDDYIRNGIAALKEKAGIEENRYSGGGKPSTYFNMNSQRRNEDNTPVADTSINDAGFITGNRLVLED